MKKVFKTLLLASACVLSCSVFCYAQDIAAQLPSETVQNAIAPIAMSSAAPVESRTSIAVVPEAVTSKAPSGVAELSPPNLIAPVVVDPKLNKPAKPSRKVDLHAILFDPTVTVKPPEGAAEMSKIDLYKYDLNEALHCTVTAPSTKGLLEDTMKMTFDKGPVESIAPWIDFSSIFQNVWSGEKYQNSLYGINFNDIGFNGKFRTNDDPASGKKTVFRLMYNVGKAVDGNTYMQSFLADNYIMRYWTKDDQVLLGYARAAAGVEGGESPFTLPFFARSQISRTYGNVRTLGLKAQGNHPLYDYSAGIFSSGRFFKDFFPGPEFVGLLSVKPLGLTDGRYGKITMGGSLNAGNAESHYCVSGAHMIYDYKRLKASAEYATADGSNGSTGYTANKSEGYYGTIAYRITPKLQALIRYDKFDPNKDKSNDMRTEYTAGLNYFIKGQALKLMLNYVYYVVENGTYGSRIMTGAQIVL